MPWLPQKETQRMYRERVSLRRDNDDKLRAAVSEMGGHISQWRTDPDRFIMAAEEVLSVLARARQDEGDLLREQME